MPLPFSDFPAHRACLTRVGGVDVDHAQTSGFGLVFDEALQLPEGPAMQSCPDTLPSLDTGADVGQVFHADFAGSGTDGFCDDGFAGFVVDVLDMPLLAPGDSPQFALCSAATVELETTTMGKVDVAVMPQLTAAPDLASAGGCEVIFAHVHPENATTGNGRRIGKIEDEVEVPDALANDQLCFLGRAAGKQIALMLAAGKRNLDAPGQGEQRERFTFHRVGALVEIDGRRTEGDCRNRLVLGNTLVGLERLVGIRHPVDGLADHLATERRNLLAYQVVRQVVERDPVPASVLLSERNYGVASLGVGIRKPIQRRGLLDAWNKFEGYSPFHIGDAMRHLEKSQEPPSCGRPAIPPRHECRGLSRRIG